MKEQTQNKKQLAFGFLIIAVLILCCYLLLSKFWNIFSSIDPRLGAGLIAASATILVSVISALFSKHLERRSAILAHLREKKIPTYEKIINFIFSITFAEKLGKKQLSDKEMVKFMAEITQELVIWGSDEMITAFYTFRMMSIENTAGEKAEPFAILITVEDLLIAIRKDLGHKNKNINRGKILGLFINDLPKSFQ